MKRSELKSLIKEIIKEVIDNKSYYDKLSDDEKDDRAMQYFSIGQDEEDCDKNCCWIWNGNAIKHVKGGTHGINFSHNVADKTFKGWYDVNQNTATIVFPN